MNSVYFKTVILPILTEFIGFPIIRADQTADKPNGPHATYKITMPYGKGVGQPATTYEMEGDNMVEIDSENYRATVSFTTYDWSDDVSREMAQSIRDWWAFYGRDFLQKQGVAIIELTDVQNRDALLLEEYERRNGFDAVLRLSRRMKRQIDHFTHIQVVRQKGGIKQNGQ